MRDRTRGLTISLTAQLNDIPAWTFQKRRDPTFKFDPEPHTYHLQDVRLWSPSGVFEQVGYTDYERIKDREKYLYRGSYVHWATHLIDQGDEGVWKQVYETGQEYLGFIEAYAEFRAKRRYRPRLSEVPIYCPSLRPIEIGNVVIMLPIPYATTPDTEGLIDGGDEAIVEKKTGTMMWWTAIQTASHEIGIHAWDKDKSRTRRRIGVELKENGKFRTEEFDDPDDYHTWVANMKTVQRLGPPREKPKVILSYI